MTYTTQAGARCGLYLVSAGIGDPDSITVKAQKTLRGVDIVFGIPRLLEAFPHCSAARSSTRRATACSAPGRGAIRR